MKAVKIIFALVAVIAAAALIFTFFFSDKIKDEVSEQPPDDLVMVYPGMDFSDSNDMVVPETTEIPVEDASEWVQRGIVITAAALAVLFVVMIVTFMLSSRTENKLETAVVTIADITVMRDSYSRFVPIEMFTLLGRESVLDIMAGDGTTITAALLELRIHGEYAGDDFFGFLNGFFSRVTPLITQNGGIIERHADNGLTAIFADGTDGALKAAAEFSSQCTAVISTENVSLGIIGSGNRISVGIVSRHTLKKLAALGEKTGCGIILTDSDTSQSRLLGYIDGRAVYDIFEYDEARLKQGKLDTREEFEHAVELYFSSDFYEARNGFIEVIKNSPRDRAAREYLLLSDSHYISGAKEFTPLLKALT